jgi:hypothetical protein
MDEKILNKAIEILVKEGLVGLPKLKCLDVVSEDDTIFVLDEFVSRTNTELPLSIVENTWLARYPKMAGVGGIDHGWGNGYVDLPEGHKYFNTHYSKLDYTIDCPGGLTYSEMEGSGMWRLGFDTCHSWNKLSKHNEEYVLKETKLLLIKLYS